jgi:hypothetical protein
MALGIIGGCDIIGRGQGAEGGKKLLKHQQKYQNPTQERERKKRRARRASTEGWV